MNNNSNERVTTPLPRREGKGVGPQIKVLLILFIALLCIITYALIPKSEALAESIVPLRIPTNTEVPIDSTLLAKADSSQTEARKPKEVDTCAQRILFVGDSMLETLGRRAADYALQNGHEIETVVWYSSNSKLWSETDTLQYFIRKHKPTFIMICLCGNELFVRDLDNRDRYIKRIVKKIGKTPFVWISPPNWKDDTGINELILKNVGRERYFDSTHYRGRMARKRDHAHPTQEAANWWMDSIALWMNSLETAHPIRMARPDTVARIKHMTLLQPVEQ